jgi:predicted outer membrane repeat protein
MSRAWVLILLVLLMPGSAFSDSSNLEGGVFIAHHPPGLQYSAGQDYCQRYFQDFAIDSCSEQNNRIDLDGNQGETSVWYVLAAWGEEKQWCGAEFGFADYDSNIYVFAHWGPCFPDGSGGGMQIQAGGWPGPNAGVSLSISGTAWSGNFAPVYWFMGYSYYQGEIPLAVNPASEFGGTANCDSPPQSWDATAFGGMGIFQDGTSACPEGLDGAGGLDGGVQPDDSQGDYVPDSPEEGATWVDLDGEPFAVHLCEARGDTIVLEMTLDGFYKTAETINDTTYYHISLPGEPVSMEAGAPELPFVPRSLVIPDDERMTVTVDSACYVDLATMPIAPSKGPLPMGVDPDSVPYAFGVAYTDSSFYPAVPDTLGRPYILRDFRGQVVHLNPFQAYPIDSSLRVYTYLRICVAPSGPDTDNVIQRNAPPDTLDAQFHLLYSTHFMNYTRMCDRGYRPHIGQQGLLLIVSDSDPDFTDDEAVDDFLRWKRQRGIRAEVVPLHDIPHTGADPTCDDIKTYIRNMCSGCDGFGSVLLIGDAAQVTSLGLDWYPEPSPHDPWYSTVIGSDSYPDILVGRFSAHTAGQVATQVRRTLEYERWTSETESEWLGYAFGLATNCLLETPDGVPNTAWMSARLDELRENLGYTCAELFNPDCTPDYGGVSYLTEHLNNGLGVMLASNHGCVEGWDENFPGPPPGFKLSAVHGLRNARRLPLIHAQSCDLGNFLADECFAEALMWGVDPDGEPTGAIGTYMASAGISRVGPQWAQEETVRRLASDDEVFMGAALFGGAAYMLDRMSEHGWSGNVNFLMWNVFGDPTLSLRRRVPYRMTAEHRGYLRPSDTEYEVVVRKALGGEPVGRAWCALYGEENGGTLYGVGYTDDAGWTSVHLHPREGGGPLVLTVMASDAVTMEESVLPAYLVDPEGNGDWLTVQGAISAAGSGWVIALADHEYSGEGNWDLDCEGKALTITSQGGDPEACKIDCYDEAEGHFGILFESGVLGRELVLRGITIAGGYRAAAGGGAVACLGGIDRSDLEAENCVFIGNYAGEKGGAVLCEGRATVSGCTFSENATEAYGGGLACYGALSLVNCTFGYNSAGSDGAGVYCGANGSGTARNTIIAFSPNGGAVFCEDEGGLAATCCDIVGNEGGDWEQCLDDLGGNISLDPCFCDWENGDYHISKCSPCDQVGCGVIGAWPVGCECENPALARDEVGNVLRYGLGPIWPSPGSGAMNVRYSLGPDCEKGRSSLRIYDVAGRLVRTLVDGAEKPGAHVLVWDARDDAGDVLGAGTYFCRLVSGGRTLAQRVVVLTR